MSEFSDIQAARAAAKELRGNTRALLGIGLRHVKDAVVNVHRKVTNPPTPQEDAIRTVEMKKARTKRNLRIAQVSGRIAGRVIGDTVSGGLSMVRGIAQGAVGYIDKATRLLAGEEIPPREAGDTVTSESDEVEDETDKEPTQAS